MFHGSTLSFSAKMFDLLLEERVETFTFTNVLHFDNIYLADYLAVEIRKQNMSFSIYFLFFFITTGCTLKVHYCKQKGYLTSPKKYTGHVITTFSISKMFVNKHTETKEYVEKYVTSRKNNSKFLSFFRSALAYFFRS